MDEYYEYEEVYYTDEINELFDDSYIDQITDEPMYNNYSYDDEYI